MSGRLVVKMRIKLSSSMVGSQTEKPRNNISMLLKDMGINAKKKRILKRFESDGAEEGRGTTQGSGDRYLS